MPVFASGGNIAVRRIRVWEGWSRQTPGQWMFFHAQCLVRGVMPNGEIVYNTRIIPAKTKVKMPSLGIGEIIQIRTYKDAAGLVNADILI
jgi:hypothetical protein